MSRRRISLCPAPLVRFTRCVVADDFAYSHLHGRARPVNGSHIAYAELLTDELARFGKIPAAPELCLG